MSRRNAAPKREILPDPKYKSVEISKFINCVMLDGKKSKAEKIVYGALEILAEKKELLKLVDKDQKPAATTEEELADVAAQGPVPSEITLFQFAFDNVKPVVEVKSRRVGGATYQVPIEVRPKRRSALGMRWIVDAARKRNEKSMKERLAAELIESVNNRGAAVKKREDTHKMAEANKAFSHYRW